MLIRNIINRYRKNKKKGFTLVELIVNMAIIGIISVMVTTLTTSTIDSFTRHKHQNDAIAVANRITSTIESHVKMSTAIKLEKDFQEKRNSASGVSVVQDQTGDNKADYMCSRPTAVPELIGQGNFEFPVCLHEVQMYTSIFVLPSDKSKFRHSDRAGLTGASRSGKLYVIDRIADAKLAEERTVGNTLYYNIKDATGHDIVIYPLLDDDFYRDFTVDVHYEYISALSPDDASSIAVISDNSAQTRDFSPESATVTLGRQNCIKVIVDVYDKNGLQYSKSSTITFSQIGFKMDKPRKTWDAPAEEAAVMKEQKEILFFR